MAQRYSCTVYREIGCSFGVKGTRERPDWHGSAQILGARTGESWGRGVRCTNLVSRWVRFDRLAASTPGGPRWAGVQVVREGAIRRDVERRGHGGAPSRELMRSNPGLGRRRRT